MPVFLGASFVPFPSTVDIYRIRRVKCYNFRVARCSRRFPVKTNLAIPLNQGALDWFCHARYRCRPQSPIYSPAFASQEVLLFAVKSLTFVVFDVLAKVWTSDGLWKGFLRCAKMMAKESGATSFIAMVQLPDKKLKEALAHPLMKVCMV